MSLVERLMHWGSYESDPEPPDHESRDRWISTHSWFAANHELLQGNLTIVQIKSYLDMTSEEEAEYDLMITEVQNVTQANQRDATLRKVEQYHSIFLLALDRMPGYSTPALVRAKMGI
jgi:hypothetical protein